MVVLWIYSFGLLFQRITARCTIVNMSRFLSGFNLSLEYYNPWVGGRCCCCCPCSSCCCYCIVIVVSNLISDFFWIVVSDLARLFVIFLFQFCLLSRQWYHWSFEFNNFLETTLFMEYIIMFYCQFNHMFFSSHIDALKISYRQRCFMFMFIVHILFLPLNIFFLETPRPG